MSAKTHENVEENAQLKKIEQMSEKELKHWIKNTLNNNYKDIKQDALELFIELTGVNYNIVSQELEKLILFIGERPIINKEDIDLINRSLEQNVFLLTEYIQKVIRIKLYN